VTVTFAKQLLPTASFAKSALRVLKHSCGDKTLVSIFNFRKIRVLEHWLPLVI
jgi:hypothetical protein